MKVSHIFCCSKYCGTENFCDMKISRIWALRHNGQSAGDTNPSVKFPAHQLPMSQICDIFMSIAIVNSDFLSFLFLQ